MNASDLDQLEHIEKMIVNYDIQVGRYLAMLETSTPRMKNTATVEGLLKDTCKRLGEEYVHRAELMDRAY